MYTYYHLQGTTVAIYLPWYTETLKIDNIELTKLKTKSKELQQGPCLEEIW